MIRSSDQVGILAEALSKAQAEFPVVPKLHRAKIPTKSGGEYSYNYADLADTVACAGPILAANGLSVSHHPDFADGYDLLTTRLMHTSGEWLEASMRLFLSAESPQAHGSAITYAKRYAYSSIIGLVADEDDDGASATRAPQTPARAAQPVPTHETVNGEQIPLSEPMETTRSGPPSTLATAKQVGFVRRLLDEAGIGEGDACVSWFKVNVTTGPWPGMLKNLSKAQAAEIIDLLK
jgi:hypothetical protein